MHLKSIGSKLTPLPGTLLTGCTLSCHVRVWVPSLSARSAPVQAAPLPDTSRLLVPFYLGQVP